MRQLDILTILMVILALLLTGCGTPGSSGSNGNGAYYDWPGWTGKSQESNRRFVINYDPATIPGPWLYIVDQVWRDVQQCTGIAASDPGLVIEYVPASQMPVIPDIQQSVVAYITYDDRYIRVVDYDLQNQSNHLRHEFVHYILWWAGVPQRDLDNHNSPFYKECLV